MSRIFEKKCNFGHNFRKITIFLKISKNFDFSQIFGNIPIWVKISEISILGKSFEKFRF